MSKTEPNLKVLIPGGLLLLPPAWIVFQGVQHLAAVPAPVAIFTIAGLVLISVILVFQGLRNLAEGDVDDARVQFVIAGLVVAAEFVGQWWFAITEHHALVTALIFSMLSLGGAAIVESELMRLWRATAREDARMSLARARVPRDIRKAFPDVAAAAERLAIRHPLWAQSLVLEQAFAEVDDRAVPVPVQVRVTALGNTITVPASAHPALSSGQDPAGAGPNPAIQVGSGSQAAQVRAAMAAGITDLAGVLAYVRRTHPDAKDDSVRRAMSKTA